MRALDISNSANIRLIVSAGNIDSKGFTARFQTWGDTRVHDVIIDWIAFQQ